MSYNPIYRNNEILLKIEKGESIITMGAEKRENEKKYNREYKDSMFRMLFNDEDKLRCLYNDLKGTDFGKYTPVIIRTLKDVVFIDIKDDIAFTIDDKFVVLIEEQSTLCENMPVRMLSYAGRLYEKIYDRKTFYKRKRMTLPVPEFFVLYNGAEDAPEEIEMRLSDSFVSEIPENSAELVVKMYNIKYNKGAELLKRNRELYEYSLFTAYVEQHIGDGFEPKAAVELAVRRCMDEGVLYDFLKVHGSEVNGMLFDYITREEFWEIRMEERAEELAEELAEEKVKAREAEIIANAEEKAVAIAEKKANELVEERAQVLAEKLAEEKAKVLAEKLAKEMVAEIEEEKRAEASSKKS